MKQTLFQSCVLLAVSIVLAVTFQAFNPYGIPYIAEEVEVIQTKDDLTVEQSSDLEYISIELAKTLYNEGVLFVDAREIDYYQEGHIPGALLSDHFQKLVFTIDSLQARGDMIVTYCDGDDCGSSEELAYDLIDYGFTNVKVFLDGWEEWVVFGYEVEK